MKLRKLAAITTAAVMTCSVLAGCSSSQPETAAAPAATEAAAEAKDETEAPAEAAESAFTPEKDLEFVVGSGAGGGADVFTREVVSIIEKNGWYPKHITVTNKPGSGHVVGYTYLQEQANDYTINVTASSFMSQPLAGNSPFTFDDFKYVALLVKDPSLLVASPKSGLKTMDDVVAFAKEHPGELMCGGSNAISDDAILVNQINEAYDIDITYVTLESGSDVITDVMGGHVDLAFGSPSEIGDNVAAGNCTAIAVASDVRLDYPGMEEIPTFLELGKEIDHQQHRGFVMASAASDEAVDYYSELILRAAQTDEWKEFIKENCMNEFVKDSQGYKDYMPELAEVYKENIEKIQANQ